jgi:sec-independent protein translocase protein TatA
MLGDIGLPELVLILLLVVVLFGPGKLPDVGKALGEAMRGFKKAINEPDEKSTIGSDKKR